MKNGNIRCRMHGGWSTGPRTPEGKAKALMNLKQYQTVEAKQFARDPVL
tara:strand:+ start:159 stop:305 length:147 start_codon:yes stop_codon:yes gene_type:complete